MDRVFEELQQSQVMRIKIEVLSVDSASIKMHPDGLGQQKKPSVSDRKSRGGGNSVIHIVVADARTAITCSLSSRQRTTRARGARYCAGRALGTDRCICSWTEPMKAYDVRQGDDQISEKDNAYHEKHGRDCMQYLASGKFE